MDWDGNVIEEESYEHEGDVALCKGGGSSSSTSVDKAYNARMATIAEDQQEMARGYYDFWQSEYKPMESAMIASNMETIEQARPIRDEFMSQSLDGVDTQARAARAGADVKQSFSSMNSQLMRDASRAGINVNSGKFQKAMSAMGNDMAKAQAGAINTARTQAEDENYKRLTSAMGMTS